MEPAIPKDSVVLVTGVNGYIGSNVADQLMEAGYRVRGTTRELSKARGLSSFWEQKFGHDRFEIVTVEDMSHDGAFDEAVKGVSGIAHVASNVSFDPNPNKVIPEVLAGINGILRSASKEPSVKRFVYTSSSTAATAPIPNKEFTIDASTWNEAAIKAAWAPPPYNDGREWDVYASSKVEGEKALWKFMIEEKPGFVANAILPNSNFGTLLAKSQPTTTGLWIRYLYDGNAAALKGIPPQWFVDVQDTARLHVACLINSDVQNERIFAFAEPFNFNDVLKILRNLRRDHIFPADFVDDGVRDRSRVANERAIELLKTLGRPGFMGLAESIENNIRDW